MSGPNAAIRGRSERSDQPTSLVTAISEPLAAAEFESFTRALKPLAFRAAQAVPCVARPLPHATLRIADNGKR